MLEIATRYIEQQNNPSAINIIPIKNWCDFTSENKFKLYWQIKIYLKNLIILLR